MINFVSGDFKLSVHTFVNSSVHHSLKVYVFQYMIKSF